MQRSMHKKGIAVPGEFSTPHLFQKRHPHHGIFEPCKVLLFGGIDHRGGTPTTRRPVHRNPISKAATEYVIVMQFKGEPLCIVSCCQSLLGLQRPKRRSNDGTPASIPLDHRMLTHTHSKPALPDITRPGPSRSASLSLSRYDAAHDTTPRSPVALQCRI